MIESEVINELFLDLEGVQKQTFWNKTLHWARQFSHYTILKGQEAQSSYGGFLNCIAVGCKAEITSFLDPWNDLKKFQHKHQQWIFGYLGYDLKNYSENLNSKNEDELAFPEMSFFIPEHIIFFDKSIKIIGDEPKEIYDAIQNSTDGAVSNHPKIKFQPSISKNEYTENVKSIKENILNGDCYELNYCFNFSAKHTVNPIDIFQRLSHTSPAPFACLYKRHNHYIISASPERFLKKEGFKIISQPMKGTVKRGNDDKMDQKLKQALQQSEKERAENMMIVDLVRNDLARTAIPGTVKVEELFGIQSFKQLHQMVSTITSEIPEGLPFTEVIKNAFPMGSMTGAPKIKVMQLIEQYEIKKRGPFSGALGFITPEMDFDFNVLIRSDIL